MHIGIYLLIANVILTFEILGEDKLKNYGPYKLEWKTFEICAAPKTRACNDYSMELTASRQLVTFHYNITNNVCSINQGRLTVFNMKGNTRKKIMNFNINNPCEHFAIGPLINLYLNVSGNCIISKANYTFTVSLTDITSGFFGKSFFYGDYLIKAVMKSTGSNFFCVNTEMANYTFTVSLTDIASGFFGKSFFYGDYLIKAVMKSTGSDFFCVNTEMVFLKP